MTKRRVVSNDVYNCLCKNLVLLEEWGGYKPIEELTPPECAAFILTDRVVKIWLSGSDSMVTDTMTAFEQKYEKALALKQIIQSLELDPRVQTELALQKIALTMGKVSLTEQWGAFSSSRLRYIHEEILEKLAQRHRAVCDQSPLAPLIDQLLPCLLKKASDLTLANDISPTSTGCPVVHKSIDFSKGRQADFPALPFN